MSDNPQQSPRRRRLEVEDIGDIAVVNFVDKKILDEQNIQMIGDDLFRLIDELGRRKLVVNFGNVEFFSSTAMGKLITLHRKLEAVKGCVVFCKIAKDILDVFKITKLDRIVLITPTEAEALRVASGEENVLANCPMRGCRGQLRFLVNPNTPTETVCPECRVLIRLPLLPLGGSVGVRSMEFVTYEGELVRAGRAYYYWALQVVGRLDLFATEMLERLWTTIPEPRCVLLDLRRTTELTRAGADVVVRMAKMTATLAVLLSPDAAFGELLPPVPQFTDKEEIEKHLKGHNSGVPPLMVTVSLPT